MSESAGATAPRETPEKTGKERATASIEDLPIAAIALGRNVREVDPAELDGLRASIEQQGILEPVLVSLGNGTAGRYTLIAGYRRVAAAKLAKLLTVPARILDVGADQIPEIQLTENLQRENLSELDEARAFKAYADAGHTQGELAKRIGKSQSYVANRIRLLGLPEKVIAKVEAGKISASHAEVLAGAPPQIVSRLAGSAEALDWTVSKLAQEAKWKAERFREHLKEKADFDAVVAKSKWPTCQTTVYRNLGGSGKGETPYACGRKAVRADYRRLPWATCGLMGHAWSLDTGKEQESPKPAGIASPPRREERGPPTPTLPFVLPEVRFPPSPGQTAEFLLGGSPKVLGVRLERGPRRALVLVLAEVGRSLPKELCGFDQGDGPEGRSTRRGLARMMDCEPWDQRTDSDRKRLASSRAFLEGWAAKLAGRRAKK